MVFVFSIKLKRYACVKNDEPIKKIWQHANKIKLKYVKMKSDLNGSRSFANVQSFPNLCNNFCGIFHCIPCLSPDLDSTE